MLAASAGRRLPDVVRCYEGLGRHERQPPREPERGRPERGCSSLRHFVITICVPFFPVVPVLPRRNHIPPPRSGVPTGSAGL